MTGPDPQADPHDNRRQVLYWRLLARLFDPEEQATLESASLAIIEDIGLPAALLDPQASVDSIVQRHPELAAEFDGLMTPEAGTGDARMRAAEVRRAALASKVLLNVFATGSGAVTAGQLACWQSDAGWLERALGRRPGDLSDIEADLVKRMRLREVLADPRLAGQLTPSMSLIEQLLRDKNNLSGVALANAKSLIRRFVDEVAEVLRTQVEKATVGALDRSVPPKRVFRNLDLDRTIWKNLTNWSPEEERLYVDRLYYRHTTRKTTPQRLIVVVDQSGSMVDSMVNCTILASIFAGLRCVDVHLIAYDTQALDLTPWVHDPFETLLRTNLGGGTNGMVAMGLLQPKIAEPRNTVVVWISDFYESQTEQLFGNMAAIHRSGAKFIPVGSVTSSGRGSVNPWFRERFKDLGTGAIGRFEELTRSTSDVQDALISILSEKYISVPELKSDNIVFAKPGFSVIATANSRDRGVNDLSSALKRRFNFVRIPVVTKKSSEAEIVRFRTGELLRRHQIELDVPPTLLDVLLQSFADLRAAAVAAGSDDEKLESALSTAEQIGVLEDAILHGNFFGERALTAHALASSLVGSLARREPEDLAILNKYLHGVVEPRSKEEGGSWPEFLEGGRDAIAALS